MNAMFPILQLALPVFAAAGEPPATLAETGLYASGEQVMSFTPQYALWSDGAAKRRWIALPPGTAIDASNPDAWEFPVGTRLWKEFGYGRAIETRFIERLDDGSWRYAAYVWNADGSDARLAPAGGIKGMQAGSVPGGRYDIPSQDDCRACHEGTAVPVLGFSALQLSPDRDTYAAHAETPRAGDVELRDLVERGLLVNFPQGLLDAPPRIEAPSAVERAALGYLHGNCGHCHNDDGPLGLLELTLAKQSQARSEQNILASLIGRRSDFRMQGHSLRVVPGRPDASVLALRMQSRDPLEQMPPLGTQLVDDAGLALVAQWIQHELNSQQETRP